MCDIDLKTCEKSSKYKKKDIVDLGKKCGVNPILPNGREKTRRVICTEIVNQYSANPSSSSSESDDDEGQQSNKNIDPICGISEKECNELDKTNLLALGEYCEVDVYTPKGNLKSSKSICKAVNKKHASPQPKIQKSPTKTDLKNMDVSNLKKLAKRLDIDWKGKNIKELQYLITKKLNSLKSVSSSPRPSRSPSPKPRSPSPKPRSPSPKPRSPSPKPRSPSPSIQNMKKKELKALAKALGASDKKLEKMDKNELIQYILSRKKSPSPRSPSPARQSRSRSPSPTRQSRSRSPSPGKPKYRAADLLGKKVVELKDLAKAEGLTKWNGKTPSKMLKQDLVDFLLHIGGGGQIPKTPSPVKPSSSPKNRAELALLKVPELKALALSYGLKKFKDKTPSQLRKNDFIDFIISTQKQKSRSPTPVRISSPPKYKSKEIITATDDSDVEEIVVKKTKKKKKRSPSVRRSRTPSVRKSPPASVRTPSQSRTPSVRKSPPASVRRSRTPSVRKSPPASVRTPSQSRTPSVRKSPPASVQPANTPSITVDPSVTPPRSIKTKKIIKPDLPKYTGKDSNKDLEILAQENNYNVVQVKGDGNCLFRAISKSLGLNHDIRYTHLKLRSMVVEYLKNNKDFLEPYLDYVTESGGGDTPEEYSENVDRYISNIAIPGVWGDFICLRVLSEVLKVKFNLLILNTRQFQIISNDDSFNMVVPLGFIDDYHYSALIPIVPSSVRPSIEDVIPSFKPASVIIPSVAPSIRPSVAPSVRPSIVPPSVAPSVRPSIVPPSVAPSVRPSIVPPSVAPSVRPSIVPPSVAPSVRPSIVPPSVAPSVRPSIVPPSVAPSVRPTPSIAPKIPPPVFGKVKPLSSVNELLEIMDKVKPYVYDDISQLQKAERQIMVSLGM
ncbi:putative ubiquitin thioesterase Virion core protein [Invertebrate iridovirus 25]|uniref:Putative ubiquitin thioesterase Virion core protein n=1 Tax=Invertebrate iridovirus 25 TaxID=1301280 RepID=W8W2D8_9VIRU|nr:putative ubiquitin thioesterase Virion core protein [Invertebrate iridovirus 25]CCV02030.1 putative ubiquitin thioesterase Virion core protein [Invertebrate iridovirus 25]